MQRILTALVAAFAMASAWAQAPVASKAMPAATSQLPGSSPSSGTSTDACCRIPAGTVVALEILDLLNSSQNKRGDKFRFRLLTPVVINQVTLVAAGTSGIGEIVHAAAARGGGAPGELLIAARSLDIEGRPAPLRGLKLGVTGGDNSAMALGVSFAAGPFAMFIRGREIEIPAGTLVNAKLAQDVLVTPARIPSTPDVFSTRSSSNALNVAP